MRVLPCFSGYAPVFTLVCALIVTGLGTPRTNTRARNQTASPTPSSVVKDGSLPVAARIEAARLIGEFDYPTSLLYRAYAQTGDPSLPEPFVAMPIGEDRTLWREIREAADRLPPDERATLEAYLLRPTDPRSPLYGANVEQGESDPLPTISGPSTGPLCMDIWGSRESTEHPGKIKVWARCNDNFDADVQKALTLFEGLWGPMTDLMGEPLPDRGTKDAGGTDAIDLYLLSGSESIFRRGSSNPAPFDTYGSLAYAIEDAPFVDAAASGFIVMDRSVLNRDDLRGTLAHEFFHILQYAHNYQIGARETGTTDANGYPVWQLNWFFEASANWAHTHFVPETASSAIHSVSFAQCFQLLDISLHSSRIASDLDSGETCHAYGAYIWSYFVEQELGSPDFIKTIWDEIASAEDWDDVMAAIDAQLSFDEHFREFAVRNLNLDLQPGDPISPSYQDHDPRFPEAGPLLQNAGANRRLDAQDHNAEGLAFEPAVPALAAHYYRFNVSDDVGQITIDLTELSPDTALDVDLIVKITGVGWQRQTVDPTDQRTFCRDNPAEQVEQFYLILSNHERDDETAVSGGFTIQSLRQEC